jgi:hypothetical protein
VTKRQERKERRERRLKAQGAERRVGALRELAMGYGMSPARFDAYAIDFNDLPDAPDNPHFDYLPESLQVEVERRMNLGIARETARARAIHERAKAACEKRWGRGTYHGQPFILDGAS